MAQLSMPQSKYLYPHLLLQTTFLAISAQSLKISINVRCWWRTNCCSHSFYLTNCGFFNHTKPHGTEIRRNLKAGTFYIIHQPFLIDSLAISNPLIIHLSIIEQHINLCKNLKINLKILFWPQYILRWLNRKSFFFIHLYLW